MRIPLLIALVVAALPLTAQDDAAPTTDADQPNPVTSQHTIEIDGQTLSFTASAGTLPLRGGSDNAETATIFHTAYTLDGVEDPASRPVSFFFNGGPGSSSVWLHLGAFGPFACTLDDNGFAQGPPFGLRDNPFTLLPFTDLVFIDPVTTGYSRTAGDGKVSDFRQVSGDIDSIAQFIRRYLSEHQRWASPVYIGGESYGTFRAAGLARRLQSRYGVYPSGVMLVSAVLNFQTIRTAPLNDIAWAGFLPTYTAVAHHHGQLHEDLQTEPLEDVLAQAEAWVMNTYWPALLRGQTLTDDQLDALATEYAYYTGLTHDLATESYLRVSPSRFRAEVLDDEDAVTGRYDGRYTLPHLDPDSPYPSGEDPSYAGIHGAFVAGIHQLFARLGYESDLEYEILIGGGWDYQSQGRYVENATDLQRAMNADPNLRVFLASGYYDLATPYFAAHHVMRHALSPEEQSRVTYGDYPAGHMMYVHRPSAVDLHADLRAWYGAAED